MIEQYKYMNYTKKKDDIEFYINDTITECVFSKIQLLQKEWNLYMRIICL